MDTYEYERLFKPKSIICANIILIAINVLVYIANQISTLVFDYPFISYNGLLYGRAVMEGEYYRMFTYMFLHDGARHIFNNMLIMYFMGNFLENTLGTVSYTVIYLLAGIMAAGGSMAINGPDSACVGASGAIFGISGAILALFIFKGRELGLNVTQLLIFIALSVYSGFTNPGVDNAAHIAGLIGGFIVSLPFVILGKKRVD